MRKWAFTPFNLEAWNQTDRRILFVAAEPNGENPNSGVLDMGDWFRTASRLNGYHGNPQFHNRCRIMLSGMLGRDDANIFGQFRFVDLKATQGGSKSSQKEIITYVKTHLDEVLRYFDSDDTDSGLTPHDVVVLGNNAQDVFGKAVRPALIDHSPTFRYVYMPHPSGQVDYGHLSSASAEANQKLVPLKLPFVNRWSYSTNFGWEIERYR